MKQKLALGILAIVTTCGLLACGEAGGDEGDGAYADHAEASDLVEVDGDGKSDGVTSSFDEHHVVSEALFLDRPAVVDAAALQAFFEATPYDGARSWLADEVVGDETVAELLERVARAHELSPLMLLARMQVEASLVSQQERPSQYKIDRAFGCGCYDGQDCFASSLGFENQLVCAAETMRKLYDQSVDGSGQWRQGEARETLDGRWITPRSHATAAMYAYTPWVLRGRGGNWLVWNITRKFVRHLGLVESFIGGACEDVSECVYMHEGQAAFCFHELAGVAGPSQCMITCEGTCPDLAGWQTTFCAAFDNVGSGLCVPKAGSRNGYCADVPGSKKFEADRFVGASSATAATALICAPESLVP